MNSKPLGRELIWLSLLCFGALVLAYLPLITDPFIRHDDFPALIGTFDIAYGKALDEGRWLNYWWQFRPFRWSSPVQFLLYLTAWSMFSAATALIMLDREAGGWYKGYLALFVALSIPAYLISFWFNTLLPGVWVITLFALAVVFLPHRAALALLLVAVPLSFMAYTTYPFLLLSLVLLSHKAPKTYTAMAVTVAVFFVGLGLAVLTAYSLNYLYHGIFGIPVADWRDPNEVRSLADLLANIEKQKAYLARALSQMGGGTETNGLVVLSLFIAAWALLLKWNRILAVGIFVAVAAGLAPLFGKALMSGVQVPLRALGWVWILLGLSFVSVAMHLSKTPGRWLSVTRLAIMYVLLFKALLIGKTMYRFLPPWQNATAELASAVPADTETIYVYGDYWGLEGARRAQIQFSRGLSLRLTYLTGADVIICDETPVACQDEDPPFDTSSWAHVPVVAVEGQKVYILLPVPDVGP